METSGIGRLLLVIGLVMAGVGALLAFGPRVPWLGRLPGDFSFGGSGWRVYLPLGTLLVLNLVIALVLWLVNRR